MLCTVSRDFVTPFYYLSSLCWHLHVNSKYWHISQNVTLHCSYTQKKINLYLSLILFYSYKLSELQSMAKTQN